MLHKAASSRSSQEFKISRRKSRNPGSVDEQTLSALRQTGDYYRVARFRLLKENRPPPQSGRSYALVRPKAQKSGHFPRKLEQVFSFEKSENTHALARTFALGESKVSEKQLQQKRLDEAMRRLNLSPATKVKVSVIVAVEAAHLLIEQLHSPLDLLDAMSHNSLLPHDQPPCELTAAQIDKTLAFIAQLPACTALIASADSPDFFKGICAFLVSVRGAEATEREEERARALLAVREGVREVAASAEKHFLYNFVAHNLAGLARQYNRPLCAAPAEGSVPKNVSGEATGPSGLEQEVRVEVAEAGGRARARRGLAKKRSNATHNSLSKEPPERADNAGQIHNYLDMYKQRKNAQIDYAKFVTFGQPVFGYANHPLNRFLVKESRSSFQSAARSLKDTLELMRNYISP